MKISKTQIVILFCLIIISIGSFVLIPKFRLYKVNQEVQQRQDRIKELTLKSLDSSGYPDQKSATDARKEICQLTARSEEDKKKAIVAIKDFLDKHDAQVAYVCSDSFYDTTNEKLVTAKSETYTVGLDTFLIDPKTNHVIQANIKDFQATSSIFTQKELEQKVIDFISKHTTSLGNIDISKLKYETNKKGSGDNINYFFTWTGEVRVVTLDPPQTTCSKDIDKNTPGLYINEAGVSCYKNYKSKVSPQIQIAINSKGQILNYSNNFEGEIGREITF